MRLAVAGLLGAVACAVSGCGQLGAGYKGMRPTSRSPVDEQAIERYPVGTPQRTVLEWFRALQQSDPVKASAFYAADVRINPTVIRFERAAGSRYFAQGQPPRIIGVSTARTSATVFTVVAFRWSAPDGRSDVYLRPQAFELERSRGIWRLADNFFLESAPDLVPSGPCPTC
jgi:hypothetical protein